MVHLDSYKLMFVIPITTLSLCTAYLEAQDVNVIVVDWSWVAGLIYPLTKTAVTPIGIFLAQFVDWLVLEAGVSVGSIHIIGHSLGAHIAGVVGAHVTTGRISRITGR